VQEYPLPSREDFPFRLRVDSPAATAELAGRAAGLLRGGEIILLHGPLGAGKTCFAQGLCAGLGVEDEVVSPTFTLVNTYRGDLTVHHLDFYRVEKGDDLADIGVPEILDEVWDGDAVLLVEWPELLLPELVAGTPRLELLAVPGEDAGERTWYLRGFPEAPPAWRELFSGSED